MPNIIPNLWFDTQAEEAANFYTSIFPNSRVVSITRYGDSSAVQAGKPVGSVMTVEFELDGKKFLGLNGGPMFQFSEAVSLLIECKDQSEVDFYWERLIEGGGQESQCGWLKDKFGFSWQVVPIQLSILMQHSTNAEKVAAALMQMKKIDLDILKAAANG